MVVDALRTARPRRNVMGADRWERDQRYPADQSARVNLRNTTATPRPASSTRLHSDDAGVETGGVTGPSCQVDTLPIPKTPFPHATTDPSLLSATVWF